MVVVDHHSDVRLDPPQPLVNGRVRGKERLPVGLVLQIACDGATDGRHVRSGDDTRDSCHVYLPASSSLDLKASFVMPVCCAPMSCTSRPKMPANLAR